MSYIFGLNIHVVEVGRMMVPPDLNKRSLVYAVLGKDSLMDGEPASYIVWSGLSEEMK